MNIFYLDKDPDRCAEYHVNKHVQVLQKEAAQMLTTAIWVDKYIGFTPRKLTNEEWKVIKDAKDLEPPIDDRQYTRYLPAHHNHPCTVWVRSSIENFEWALVYLFALDSECHYRGYKRTRAYEAATTLPDPKYLKSVGLTPHALAMPDIYVDNDPIIAYRNYYKNEKKHIASWKHRERPYWWES